MGSETIQFSVDASTALTGELDVEALIALIPELYTIRGLFFTALVAELGSDLAAFTPKLCAPPPSGKYFALTAYPVRDQVRLLDAVACRLYPSCSNREAHRLHGRTELRSFSQSLLGKAMVSIMADPATMLLRVPEFFVNFVKGPSGQASRVGPQAVKLELLGYFGGIEYMVGVLEGLVLNFNLTPHTEVRGLSPSHWIFLVEWH